MTRRRSLLAVGAFVATAALASPVSAQTTTGPSSLQIQKVDNKWVLGPDFRVTDVEGDLSTMAGVYGGRLLDNRLLIGAGAYWLVDGPRDTDMRYFGPLVEWSTNNDSRVNVSVRSLFGWGSADRSLGFSGRFGPGMFGDHDFGPSYEASHGGRGFGGFGRGFGPGRGGFDRGRGFGFGSYYDEFFVAEPHLGVLLHGADWLSLNLGAGYRLIGGGNDFDRSLSGASFSFGLRLGR